MSHGRPMGRKKNIAKYTIATRAYLHYLWLDKLDLYILYTGRMNGGRAAQSTGRMRRSGGRW